jgi:hypothetical protein
MFGPRLELPCSVKEMVDTDSNGLLHECRLPFRQPDQRDRLNPHPSRLKQQGKDCRLQLFRVVLGNAGIAFGWIQAVIAKTEPLSPSRPWFASEHSLLHVVFFIERTWRRCEILSVSLRICKPRNVATVLSCNSERNTRHPEKGRIRAAGISPDLVSAPGIRSRVSSAAVRCEDSESAVRC